MRRMGSFLVMAVLCLMLVGCFQVKNADGLRAAYEKIQLAYPLAIEIAGRGDLKPGDRQGLIDSYNAAKGAVNSFLDDIKTKSFKVVDVPMDAFEKSNANEKLDKFIDDAKASRAHIRSPLPVIVDFAVQIIEKVWDLNKKDEKEAYERFTKIVDDNKMVAFTEVPEKLKH